MCKRKKYIYSCKHSAICVWKKMNLFSKNISHKNTKQSINIQFSSNAERESERESYTTSMPFLLPLLLRLYSKILSLLLLLLFYSHFLLIYISFQIINEILINKQTKGAKAVINIGGLSCAVFINA